MRDIWVSSDWHLFHQNILKFVNSDGEKIRPNFNTVQEMNEAILERHNSHVKPGDIYYNLGDVTFYYGEDFDKFFSKFHGKKRLIVGNHDKIEIMSTKFQKTMLWRKMPDFGLIFSHIPLHESCLENHNEKYPFEHYLNIHGHIHAQEEPSKNHMNVCVEKTNYAPIHIDDLRITNPD